MLRTGEVSSATQQLCPSNVEPRTMTSRSFNNSQDALAMFPDALRYRSSTSSQVFSGLPGRCKLTASFLRPSCDKLAAKPERALIPAVVHSFEALLWMRSAHVQRKPCKNDTLELRLSFCSMIAHCGRRWSLAASRARPHAVPGWWGRSNFAAVLRNNGSTTRDGERGRTKCTQGFPRNSKANA